MKPHFNLARQKLARRLGSPVAFQPPRDKGDPYYDRQPGDGRGNTLNSPGDEGIAGAPPKGTGFGSKDREK